MAESRLKPRSSTPKWTLCSWQIRVSGIRQTSECFWRVQVCWRQDSGRRQKWKKRGNGGKERVQRETKDVRVRPSNKQTILNLKSFHFPRVWGILWSNSRALFESGDNFAEASCGWKKWAHIFKASRLIWQPCNTFCSESDAPLSLCSKEEIKV